MAEERITKDQVQHVAELAKLEFNDADLQKFTGQLESIIGLFEQLNEVDTTDVPVTTQVNDRHNALRDDVAVRSDQRDALLANAPETERGMIKVPAIIDESGDGE